MEISLLSRYTRARLSEPGFDAPNFARLYATMAAQRASKILGIFARLDRRDGKPQYLRHMPRVWAYLQRSLAHPALAPLRAWYAANVPALKSTLTAWPNRTAQRRVTPWCWPPGSAPACGRSPTRCRSRWSRSAARRCSITCSTGWPRPASKTAVVNIHYLGEQIEKHVAGAQAAAHHHLGRARRNCSAPAAAWSRRCDKLGGAPFFHVNADTHLDRRREAQSRAAGGSASTPAGWTRCCCWRRPPAASAIAGRGDFAMAPDGRLTRRGEREVAPFVYAGAAILSPAHVPRRAERRILADRICSSAPPKPAGCTACGSTACGCMSARPRPSPPRKPRSRPAPTSRARAQSVYDFMAMAPRVFNIPASAPFLPVLVARLLDGKLIKGFPASDDPLELARLTLYLPTRRAVPAGARDLSRLHRPRRRDPAAHRRDRRSSTRTRSCSRRPRPATSPRPRSRCRRRSTRSSASCC